MALLSGLEILLVVLIVSLLFLLSVRFEKRRLNPLPFLFVALLILAVFFLGRALLAFFAITVLLTLVVLVLLAVIVFRLTLR
jgi:hypothetical protein